MENFIWPEPSPSLTGLTDVFTGRSREVVGDEPTTVSHSNSPCDVPCPDTRYGETHTGVRAYFSTFV